MSNQSIPYHLIAILLFLISGCSNQQSQTSSDTTGPLKVQVIIDTDANNELDDQHALAYLFFNEDVFEVLAVTVNATYNGGNIDEQLLEAERVMKLCNVMDQIPLLPGADANFDTIRQTIGQPQYDGYQAVDFIIKAAREAEQELVLLPIGKLTNIALALEIAPDIKEKIRIVWLGSNYPEKGEYNQDNDIPSLNYILDQEVPFEMVMVRYGQPSGSDAVRATPEDIQKNMPGIGPEVNPVEGRHGGTFTNFGDYSVNLFQGIDLHGDPPSRALYDMVAVAILKNPEWGEIRSISAPILIDEEWQERPDNNRRITIWENFNQSAILDDFYEIMRSAP